MLEQEAVQAGAACALADHVAGTYPAPDELVRRMAAERVRVLAGGSFATWRRLRDCAIAGYVAG